MTRADIHGPNGMIIETTVVDRWSHERSTGVSTTFGTFLRNRADGPLEWVRDSNYVLQELAPCPPSSNG